MNNIDTILLEIQNLAKKVIKFDKMDGITIVCYVPDGESCKEGIKEIKTICKKLSLKPIAIEENKEMTNVFILQLPELNPIYSDEELTSIFKYDFQWIFDNIRNNTDETIKKDIALRDKDVFVRQAIRRYTRSNINPYREKYEDYINNYDFRNKVNKLYEIFVDEYFYKLSK